MRRLCYMLFAAMIFLSGADGRLKAHNLSLPVIVDTDMGADDGRAIVMLLNSGSVDLRLMATSDGVLAPDTGARLLTGLLEAMDRSGIPVVEGSLSTRPAPRFRPMNQELGWPGNQTFQNVEIPRPEAAAEAIIQAVLTAGADTLYLCLGPMSNLAAALQKEPSIVERIERVVYLGGAPEDPVPGWNTERDRKAAEAVYRSGLRIISLGLSRDVYPVFDRDLMAAVSGMETRAASLVTRIHGTPAMQAAINAGHMKVWDELVVIFLNQPQAFRLEDHQAFPGCQRIKEVDRALVRQAWLKLLGNPADFHLDERSSVVLKAFPTETASMRDDVAAVAPVIIERHGLEEWKACLLTNELHRHLGIYSLVGAKMGIRAREILNAPFDSLEVISAAGLKPPLSCMNDGLQVSTGASLGRGTIRVLEEASLPSAEFVHGGTRFRLILKPEYVERIRSDIAEAIQTFGGIGPAYFAHIRGLSIKYWHEFDRNLLFKEELRK